MYYSHLKFLLEDPVIVPDAYVYLATIKSCPREV